MWDFLSTNLCLDRSRIRNEIILCDELINRWFVMLMFICFVIPQQEIWMLKVTIYAKDISMSTPLSLWVRGVDLPSGAFFSRVYTMSSGSASKLWSVLEISLHSNSEIVNTNGNYRSSSWIFRMFLNSWSWDL